MEKQHASNEPDQDIEGTTPEASDELTDDDLDTVAGGDDGFAGGGCIPDLPFPIWPNI